MKMMSNTQKRMQQAVRWFWLALQFGTILPTPKLKDVSVDDMRRSVVFYPVVGGVLGAFLWLVDWELSHRLPSLSAALCAFAVYTLLSGALHLDGLMDTADAVGSHRPRERALEIMKDSRVGAMGVVAAVIVMGGKVSALSGLSTDDIGLFIAVPAVSRACMAYSMAMSPSARQEGLGSVYAKQVPVWVLWTASAVTVVISAVCLPVTSDVFLLATAALVTVCVTWFVRRRFGGTTGDTYGALNELVEWIGWTVLLALR